LIIIIIIIIALTYRRPNTNLTIVVPHAMIHPSSASARLVSVQGPENPDPEKANDFIIRET
jgi:hypothetical protein